MLDIKSQLCFDIFFSKNEMSMAYVSINKQDELNAPVKGEKIYC